MADVRIWLNGMFDKVERWAWWIFKGKGGFSLEVKPWENVNMGNWKSINVNAVLLNPGGTIRSNFSFFLFSVMKTCYFCDLKYFFRWLSWRGTRERIGGALFVLHGEREAPRISVSGADRGLCDSPSFLVRVDWGLGCWIRFVKKIPKFTLLLASASLSRFQLYTQHLEFGPGLCGTSLLGGSADGGRVLTVTNDFCLFLWWFCWGPYISIEHLLYSRRCHRCWERWAQSLCGGDCVSRRVTHNKNHGVSE